MLAPGFPADRAEPKAVGGQAVLKEAVQPAGTSWLARPDPARGSPFPQAATLSVLLAARGPSIARPPAHTKRHRHKVSPTRPGLAGPFRGRCTLARVEASRHFRRTPNHG